MATRTRTEPQQVTPDVLADDVIAEYLPAARKRWPLFARDGTRQATDPVWQSRLVRMYLADLRRGTDLEGEGTG